MPGGVASASKSCSASDLGTNDVPVPPAMSCNEPSRETIRLLGDTHTTTIH